MFSRLTYSRMWRITQTDKEKGEVFEPPLLGNRVSKTKRSFPQLIKGKVFVGVLDLAADVISGADRQGDIERLIAVTDCISLFD